MGRQDAVHWQKAQENLLRGRFRDALIGYQTLVKRFPSAPELWFELGNAAAGDLDFTLANQSYQHALKLAPRNARLLLMVGQQYQGLRQLDQARACFEQAVAADPNSVDARITLAAWFEKERRLDEAWQCVLDCEAGHPRDDQVRYFRAFLLHRKGHSTEAESALRDLIRDEPRYPYVKYASRHLLGVVLDQQGRHPEAMRWLTDGKGLVRQITDTSVLEREYDKTSARRRELLGTLTAETLRRWRAEAPGVELGRQIAFLGGHPRSGTTLLEQILDAQQELRAFDEAPAFNQEVCGRLTSQAGAGLGIGALNGMPVKLRTDLRQRYLASLLQEVGEPASWKVLLDKNPSATMLLHVWLRVFPEVKVIIALRDPRDVIISCYFQNLMLNVTNVNFLSLERTAKHYADLMDVWLKHRELGGFDWLETRYEDVVANLEREGRKATEFLGLGWHANQARYHENSRRKFLYAPTYHDVTQPVYKRAVGRWQSYAEALEPIQKTLTPYCRAFRYDV